MSKAPIIRTESGELAYGVEYEGELHYDFEMRLTTIADNIEALEKYGAESGLRITTAMYAAAIVKLGSIPADVLTADFVMGALAEPDFDTLAAAQERLKKKRRRSSSGLPASGSPSLPSGNTESPKPPLNG